ncbi:MAG: hybrid sensor histidine kinase/response regulator [Rhizobiaceae bacterium]|nr:hybrid sensor histidine kinase/response regulator [Rhizobiaceae bacterium]
MLGLLVVLTAVVYVTLLFAVASFGDRRAAREGPGLPRPYIYALSLAIYCTSWTFFGSVGLASERNIEFLAIYVGPILVFLFGFPLLNRLARLAKGEKITSIADFLGARYGKSFSVAAIATLIATIGAVPYIALQLKAISGSVNLMVEYYTGAPLSFYPFVSDISLVVAVLLALFAILFGTRHADATEHQDGLVLAVAVESIVKLVAFLAVGLFTCFILFGSPSELADKIAASSDASSALDYRTSLGSWLVVTALSGFAIILLPRQFYVMIVENRSTSELRTATWLFPLYLIAINLFVLPIALAGRATVGDATSSDLYVLSVPLLQGHNTLAMIAYIGGLSAATAMVIVESVALSIMISNDLVIPIFVRRLLTSSPRENEDWSAVILHIRRAAIFIILFTAFLYYRESTGNSRLSAIGLMSFAAIAQFAPAFVGGLIWRGANSRGAILGMAVGITVWGYTLLLPTLAAPDAAIVLYGPLGIESLKPQALFGTVAEPLNHGVLWSLSLNLAFFILGSLSRAARPLERIQASIFVRRDAAPAPSLRRFRTRVTVNQLKDTIGRYLGVERTERSFQSFQNAYGRVLDGNEQAGTEVIRFSEQLLASAVGSSSSRLILSLLLKRNDASARDAYRLLDDATEALQQNRDLLQIALDQMEQGITVFDSDLRLTCWNRQYRSLFNLPDELGQVGVSLDLILRSLVERGEITTAMRAEALKRIAASEGPWQMELKHSRRIIEIRSNPMPDGGMVATYADISARVEADLALKSANESLELRVRDRTSELLRVNEELAQAQMLADEANQGKTRFLAAAGHDILQPLNAARLYCASLIEKARDRSVSEAANNIESSLDSVETILGAVLDISRLDAGAMTPSPSVFELGALLKQIGTDFQPLALEKNLRLTLVPSSLRVSSDRNLLRRLIQNLVSNAIKYTRTGRILVGVRHRGELAEIQIFDTGIGIDVEKLSSVFSEFTRLEEGKREAPGLGLGLSIVDRIARVLQVELRIHSEKGRGTCFSILLPVTMQAAPALVTTQPVPKSVGRTLAGLHVLCIDNDSRILDSMRILLEGWGCVVRTAADGAGAADGPSPHIVLADYHLDRESGLDAIKLLRQRWGYVPAVLVTADRSSEVRSAAAEIDVPVLNKPVKPAALRSMITRLRQSAEAAE